MRDLEAADFHLLSGIEHGMRFAEWVNRDRLPEFSNLKPQEISYRLDRCLDKELIERRTIQYEGYQLTFEGYDALALRTFSERETITEVGAPLGEGKESDVLEARNERPVALKFHREGLTNFREVRREREYTADRQHVSWLYTARIAAEREFDMLDRLYPAASVPEPIDHNRHAIVMEIMPGVELSRARLEDSAIRQIFLEILSELAAAFQEGIVHADISEYNVFVEGSSVTIFDWPQAVSRDHPNAEEFLRRDIDNLLGYFHRKYPGSLDEDLEPHRICDLIRSDSLDELRINSDI